MCEIVVREIWVVGAARLRVCRAAVAKGDLRDCMVDLVVCPVVGQSWRVCESEMFCFELVWMKSSAVGSNQMRLE